MPTPPPVAPIDPHDTRLGEGKIDRQAVDIGHVVGARGSADASQQGALGGRLVELGADFANEKDILGLDRPQAQFGARAHPVNTRPQVDQIHAVAADLVDRDGGLKQRLRALAG